MARKSGRLLKGGEPDSDGVARMVINDFLRGKLPWFTPVPKAEGREGDDNQKTEKETEKESGSEVIGADKAKSKKRKRSDEADPERTEADTADPIIEKDVRDQIDDTFEGFPSDNQLPFPTDEEHSDDDRDVSGENEYDDGISHHDTDEEPLFEGEIIIDEMAYADKDKQDVNGEEESEDDEDSDDGGGGVKLGGGQDDA